MGGSYYTIIALEEAHEFLDPNNRGHFSLALPFYRKYRVGLNAVTPRPSGINFDAFAELWAKVIMRTGLEKDRAYLNENTPHMEYTETEIKMLDEAKPCLFLSQKSNSPLQ